ncbi:MAG: transglycosylase domain-containing protein [Pseudomonadota bacterium]|nr:transglycosylase domain-containing protein [Pseudomonadota bacterium]
MSTRTRSGTLLRRLSAWLLLLSLLGAAVVTVLAVGVELQVRREFGDTASVIADRVLGAPSLVRPQTPLTPTALATRLRELGYQPVSDTPVAGQFRLAGGTVEWFARRRVLPHGVRPAERLVLSFAGGRVERIGDAEGGSRHGVYLDAPLVATLGEPEVLRHHLPLTGFPPFLKAALVAVEDQRFETHAGVDGRAIVRALWANVRAGQVVQGGSTLTQQLVRSRLLDNRQTWLRKLHEALASLLLERHFSKPDLLEAYLNEVYLGQDGARAVRGFGAAAEFYFGRPPAALALHEQALLVALVRGPSYYNPRRHPERARARRDLVLDVAAARGLIDPGAAARAHAAPLTVAPLREVRRAREPDYLDLVRAELASRWGVSRPAGRHVFTSIEPRRQARMAQAIDRVLERLDPGAANQVEAAVVLVEPRSGRVVAVRGGREGAGGFNRALQARRPIGSAVKPAVYLTALAQPRRFTLLTPLEDAPVTVPLADGREWTPTNDEGRFHGQVPLMQALVHSYNAATVRLGMAVGPPAVVRTLQRLGLERPVAAFPSLLLGAVELSPLELAQIYQPLAAEGVYRPLHAVTAVREAHGSPLTPDVPAASQAFEPGPVYLVAHALQEAARRGTGAEVYRHLSGELAIAGKTGTTNGTRDSWFAGFTGDWLAIVWLGRDDNRPTGLYGASGALRVWAGLMGTLEPAPLQLRAPARIDWEWVLPARNARAPADCPGARQLPFIRGSAPQAQVRCERPRPDAAPPAPAEPAGLGEILRRWFGR